MTKPRAAFLVLLVSLGAYANSLGNGFAYDDTHVIELNPVVTQPDLGRALLGPYWHDAVPGSGLYRPVVITSFALEWQAFGGSPFWYHLGNVLAHTGVALLVLSLLSAVLPLVPALCGALLFAVHPVHVEAVANVVGRAEIYAAGAFLLACLLYLRGDSWGGGARAARQAGIAALYLLGLGAKEIAVSLPAVLVAIELVRSSEATLRERLRAGLPVYATLAVVLAGYLMLRAAVLGTVTGELPAPALRGLTDGQRIFTALTVWPEYLRLLFFPLDLASDYSPAVLMTVDGVTPDVVAGGMLVGGLIALAWLLRERAPWVAMGIAWFVLTILPVSNLIVPAGIMLAERTLYLPSVGLSILAAGLVARIPDDVGLRTRTLALTGALVVGTLLTVRTTLRNTAWLDTYTMLNTLAVEHPESFVSLRSRAVGLQRVGDLEGAGEAYDLVVSLAPMHYGYLVEAANFFGEHGDLDKAIGLLAHAADVQPVSHEAYRLWSEYLIRQGRGRDGHRIALVGLENAGPDQALYALLSESYIAKGDLEAALRARRAALGQDPFSASDWDRLADLLEALDRPAEAQSARATARELDGEL